MGMEFSSRRPLDKEAIEKAREAAKKAAKEAASDTKKKEGERA